MLTQDTPLREAASLWARRSTPSSSDRSTVRKLPKAPALPPAAMIDVQMEGFLLSLKGLMLADELILSFRTADDQEPISQAAGPTGLSPIACRCIAECGPAGLPAGGEAMWLDCLADGRAWQVLRLAVPSGRGRSNAVASFVFAEATPARRRAVSEQLSTLRPMVEAHLKLWQRGRADARRIKALHSALSSIDIGIIAIDRNARIVFANEAATAHLASGEHLRRSGDSLSAVELRDALFLQVALSHTLARPAGPDSGSTVLRAPILALRSPRTDESILLSFIPADGASGDADDAAAIVCILDPRLDTARQLQPVCKLYGLSPVETGLVCHIANGESLLEAAAALRIKEKTARGYLQQIFSKTGCKRQADLVRLMLCSLLRTRRDIEPAFLV